jgi:hypothetical protein
VPILKSALVDDDRRDPSIRYLLASSLVIDDHATLLKLFRLISILNNMCLSYVWISKYTHAAVSRFEHCIRARFSVDDRDGTAGGRAQRNLGNCESALALLLDALDVRHQSLVDGCCCCCKCCLYKIALLGVEVGQGVLVICSDYERC